MIKHMHVCAYVVPIENQKLGKYELEVLTAIMDSSS